MSNHPHRWEHCTGEQPRPDSALEIRSEEEATTNSPGNPGTVTRRPLIHRGIHWCPISWFLLSLPFIPTHWGIFTGFEKTLEPRNMWGFSDCISALRFSLYWISCLRWTSTDSSFLYSCIAALFVWFGHCSNTHRNTKPLSNLLGYVSSKSLKGWELLKRCRFSEKSPCTICNYILCFRTLSVVFALIIPRPLNHGPSFHPSTILARNTGNILLVASLFNLVLRYYVCCLCCDRVQNKGSK